MVKESLNIPKEVKETIKTLNGAGFEAYAVGGCVRDFIIGREPYDWDITTNAKPEEIGKLFTKSVYENDFGTVAINTESNDPKLKIIEITTYRVEEKYTDKRHPDSVKFTSKLEEDLARRDFTINAIALQAPSSKLQTPKIIDPFGGQEDIKNRIIRTVGNPDERFNEDALRLMRAVRFAVQLGFNIEEKTAEAIKKNSGDLVTISKERIRDEFSKIIMSTNAKIGVKILRKFGLLKLVAPEIEEGIGVKQKNPHIHFPAQHVLTTQTC